MRRIAVPLIMGIIVLVLSIPLRAQSGYAVTLKASTLGAEFGLVRAVLPKMNARVGLEYFAYSRSGETGSEDPVKYNVDLNLFSVFAAADYYPFANWFRLSGGVVYNDVFAEMTGKAVKTYTVSNHSYTPDEIGALTGRVEPSLSLAPYIGIGIGNPVSHGNRVGFVMDIGVLYYGSPDVSLEADKNSMIFPTTEQEADVEKDLENLKWYPFLGFGVSYQF